MSEQEKDVRDWHGAEEWMPLAWELCANECGEEACNEFVWEGAPIPEPWGDRWLKYEDQAKQMIAMVRKSLQAAAFDAAGAAGADRYADGYRAGTEDARAIAADALAGMQAQLAERDALLAQREVDAAAPAVPAVPEGMRLVAKVTSWTNGSYWRNYKLGWMDDSNDLEAGAELYVLAAAPQAAAPAAPLQLETAEEARKDREHAEAYYRQAERLLTANEKTLNDEVARLRAQLAAAPQAAAPTLVPVPGAVWGMYGEESVALIQRGTEGERIAKAGGERLYRLAPQAAAPGDKEPSQVGKEGV